MFLGVFLALGMSLSAVQSNDMAAKMAMASDMGDSGMAGCGACGSDDDGNTGLGVCTSMCTASAPAMLPIASVATAPETNKPLAPSVPASRGRAFSPDPYPPRSFAIG